MFLLKHPVLKGRYVVKAWRILGNGQAIERPVIGLRGYLPLTRIKKATVLKGQSFYAGDGLNKALVSVPALMAAISSVLA